jgi:hypothetical protein
MKPGCPKEARSVNKYIGGFALTEDRCSERRVRMQILTRFALGCA